MFAPCFAISLLSAAVSPAADGKDPFEPSILVQAKAVRVDSIRDGHWVNVKFRIEHVFSGDDKLKGTTFQDAFTLETKGLNFEYNFALYPPVREGEVGIWNLEYSEKDGKLYPFANNRGFDEDDGLFGRDLAIPVPARKIIGPLYTDPNQLGRWVNRIDYTLALKWARIVEKVYKANCVERLKMLREYVYCGNPYVAAWSVYVLNKYKPNDMIPFFEKLIADPKLPVGSQVSIDKVFCDTIRKKWMFSKLRSTLLDRWVSGGITETQDALIIAARIRMALYYRIDEEDKVYQELDWKTWLPLMEKWMVEQYLTSELEGRLYRIYHRNVPEDYPVDVIIFSYSLNLLKTTKDPERQRFAAQWICELNLSDDQLSIVKDLIKKSTHARTRSLLESAVKEAERSRVTDIPSPPK